MKPEHRAPSSTSEKIHTAIVIGSGFGGIGMAVSLKRAGHDDFLILEKGQDVGGVWRDNTYPGAACDVPSHLYSFSFAPNPGWSRVFAAQGEIHAYLKDCAERFDVRRHVRFGAEVVQAAFDERTDTWVVTLRGGQTHRARLLVSATGQLSRPAFPKLPGLANFEGRSFHSAQWDHAWSAAGQRVAVVGTGASAIQFVPALAPQVASLTVFQRSPAYILPRPDRPYSAFEKAVFKALPGTMRLQRTSIYLQYESRALAFTRFKSLMTVAGMRPFKRLLRQQVSDPALRVQLTPDYPVGCKRILLSSQYLATMARPNVHLVSEGISEVTATGIRTADGRHHEVDAIVFGTGFAATEFLSPMRVLGRDGLDIHTAWQQGAKAYLGMAVPGFPNFFMLYGPNTNLGHNSIVYMIESQIAHVMRCLAAMKARDANRIEVNAGHHERFNAGIQSRLKDTVWNGCKSWYVDANGHNSTNWPGFTLSYRRMVKRGSLQAYSLSRPAHEVGMGRVVSQPPSLVQAMGRLVLQGLLRVAFKPLIGPPFPFAVQRAVVRALSTTMLGVPVRAQMAPAQAACPRTEWLWPQAQGPREGVILYLHGGAFCLGSPATHRSVTTRLAQLSGMAVCVPDYRLAPEHPWPAGLDDVHAAYTALLQQGHAPKDIVVAGDSAGGALALALALRLKAARQPMPAGLMLLSPVTDPALGGDSRERLRHADPMIRTGWLRQALHAYQCPATQPEQTPLLQDLHGLPPMLIQVGSEETLLSDATRLAQRARVHGVSCHLEVQQGLWHVYQLQARYLSAAQAAMERLADFARMRVRALSDSEAPSLSTH